MIRVVVDSTTSLPAEQFTRYNIGVVPISIQFGTQTFREGVDIDQHTFYARIDAERHLPKTSQPSPGEFAEVYRKVAQRGDTILSMHVTGKLSGTVQSAQLAAEQVKGDYDVRVFDSLNGSAGLGFMAVEAARMIERGEPVDTILARLTDLRDRTFAVLTPENLKYLQMSGRVSNVAALIGSALSLKPLIGLDNGTLHPIGRIRTRSRAIDHLLATIKDKCGDQAVNLAVVHAEAAADAQQLMTRAKETLNIKESFVDDLATSLAVHFGPGVLGIFAMVV